MSNISALGPIDPQSIALIEDATGDGHEKEKAAPWIIRKLVGSMTGRIVLSSYETLRAAGTNVVCLSPWGDSSPLLLPCIRFRDLAVHTVIAATVKPLIAPAAVLVHTDGSLSSSPRCRVGWQRLQPQMGPVSDVVVNSFGDTILVEVGLHAGFDLSAKMANDLVFDKPIKHLVPIHSKKLMTTGTKEILITLKYKHTMDDAALGFYRSSVHSDTSLFSTIKDYLAVEKGWFSPYLFASARRPIIPRSIKPDIIFCHGPFLAGDYRIGETLLAESVLTVTFCDKSTAPLDVPEKANFLSATRAPAISNLFSRSRTPSLEPALTPLPEPPVPRRMVILVLGIKPHRKLWTTSARPGESVLNYILLNGCPAIVVPVKVGSPLIAWDSLTLEKLWNVELPAQGGMTTTSGKFEGIVKVLMEFLELCVDWDRVEMSLGVAGEDTLARTKQDLLLDAVKLLVAGAVRTGESKEAKKALDEERSGIAMWRIP